MSNVTKGLLWLLACFVITGCLVFIKSGLTVLIGAILIGAAENAFEESTLVI